MVNFKIQSVKTKTVKNPNIMQQSLKELRSIKVPDNAKEMQKFRKV